MGSIVQVWHTQPLGSRLIHAYLAMRIPKDPYIDMTAFLSQRQLRIARWTNPCSSSQASVLWFCILEGHWMEAQEEPGFTLTILCSWVMLFYFSAEMHLWLTASRWIIINGAQRYSQSTSCLTRWTSHTAGSRMSVVFFFPQENRVDWDLQFTALFNRGKDCTTALAWASSSPSSLGGRI